MYRLSIVDDEPAVLDRLKQLIMRIPNSNFILDGIFENGDDAFNQLSVLPPDILITDIHIPFITGIELVKKLKKIHPLLKVIMITGYDEIDYAKQAIDLGVIGYISKPISFDEITRVLQKAKQAIEHESYIESNIHELTSFYQESLPTIRENYLTKLIQKKSVDDKFFETMQRVGISLNFPYMILCVFDFDHVFELTQQETLLIFMKKNIIPLISTCFSHELFQKDHQLIILFKSNDPIDNLESLYDVIRTLMLKVNKYYNFSISVGLSATSFENHNFNLMYQQATESLSLRRILGGSQLFVYDDIKEDKVHPLTLDDALIQELTFLVKYDKHLEKLPNFFEFLKKVILRPHDLSTYAFNLSNILNAIIKASDDYQILINHQLDYASAYQKLIELKTIDETFEWFFKFAKKIQQLNTSQMENLTTDNMNRVLNYIDQNYTDQSLSLETLTQHVNFSISYITTLFKKVKSTTFVKYLTMVRMEKAKELLQTSQHKIIEISELVGYNEPYYFSYCFKKYFGYSPKEFRNDYLQDKK